MAVGASSVAEASGQQQKPQPEFTGPLNKEKLPTNIEASKPNGLNLIVIICDTFRYDYLHCNGNGRIRTPNLDAFAEEGTLFTNCYADGLPDHSRAARHAHRAEHSSRAGEMDAA